MMEIINGELAYFSHSKRFYNTEYEFEVYNFIKKIFNGFVFCPNKHIGDLFHPNDYAYVASKADCIFLLADINNHTKITHGCFREVDLALKLGNPVYLVIFKKGKYKLREVYWAYKENADIIEGYADIKSRKLKDYCIK